MTTPPTKTVGRPRPPEIVARDERIYQLLATRPRTRNKLAIDTGLEPSIVYLSLARLRDAGRIRQCVEDGTIIWAIQDGTPCP